MLKTRTVRVSLALFRLIDGKLLIRARNIITMMTGNASYLDPKPTLLAVKDGADAFELAIQAALTGGTTLTDAKNVARATLTSLLRDLSYFVQNACGGDRAVLVSSGFEATKAPTPAGVLGAPGNPRVSHTNISGEFAFTFDKVVNAAIYMVQSSTSPTGPWEDEGGFTSIRVVLSGFTPGTVYWFAVYAIGTAGDGAVSDAVSLMAI